MPIVFSAVACERNIVADFACCDGNFVEIAQQVLSKLPLRNNKMTYSHGIYLLHYIVEDNYLYFCITDKLCQRSRAFLFLNEIQRRFTTSKPRDDFRTVLAAEMYRYSEDYSTITIRKGELDELNNIGVGGSESILGEKILYINNPDNKSYSTISQVSAIPERISVSVVSQTAEGTLNMNATPEKISVSVTSLTPKNVNTSHERISDVSSTQMMSPTLERNSVVGLNSEKKDVLNSTPNKMPVVTPRLYIIIIGMIILVIGMAIYAFGPISCATVTSIGIYSLLRYYVHSKNKSE